jgi:hypothetical protein
MRSAAKQTTAKPASAKPSIGKRTAGLIAGVGLLALLIAVLAISSAWPFDSSGGIGDGGHAVVWKGDVALLGWDLYALDQLPVAAKSDCPFCLSPRSEASGRHPELYAGNGILGWAGDGTPSYRECVELRNHMTLDKVALDAPRTRFNAVALHGWACATGGGKDGLIRIRYDGQRGGRFLFYVTSWGRPVEG